MALSVEEFAVPKSGKAARLQCKITKATSIYGEYYRNERMNVDKNELVNLYDDMKELSNQLKIVASSSVKEVILHKDNVILVEMASIIEDYTRNEEYTSCGTEMKKGKATIDREQFVRYAIPVINNRYRPYRLLENQEWLRKWIS
jgi:hypothetical protein